MKTYDLFFWTIITGSAGLVVGIMLTAVITYLGEDVSKGVKVLLLTSLLLVITSVISLVMDTG